MVFFFFFFLVYSPFLLLFLSNKETFPLYFYLLYLLASHKFISSSIYSFNFLSFQIFFLVFQKKKKKNIPHPHVLNIKKKKIKMLVSFPCPGLKEKGLSLCGSETDKLLGAMLSGYGMEEDSVRCCSYMQASFKLNDILIAVGSCRLPACPPAPSVSSFLFVNYDHHQHDCFIQWLWRWRQRLWIQLK